MHLPRCHVDPVQWTGSRVELSEEESHQVARVLRMSAGDALELFDGEGRHARATVEHAGRGGVVVRADEPELEPVPDPHLGLYPALPKGEKSDFLVQKAVELGYARIGFVETERSVARWPADEERRVEKLERWRRVAIAAAKQCGRSRLPVLETHASVRDMLAARAAQTLMVFGSLSPEARPAGLFFRRLTSPHRTWAAAFGPEGGFTDAEEARLRDAGVVPLALGPHVLRTETAGLFLMCLLAHEAWTVMQAEAGREAIRP